MGGGGEIEILVKNYLLWFNFNLVEPCEWYASIKQDYPKEIGGNQANLLILEEQDDWQSINMYTSSAVW